MNAHRKARRRKNDELRKQKKREREEMGISDVGEAEGFAFPVPSGRVVAITIRVILFLCLGFGIFMLQYVVSIGVGDCGLGNDLEKTIYTPGFHMLGFDSRITKYMATNKTNETLPKVVYFDVMATFSNSNTHRVKGSCSFTPLCPAALYHVALLGSGNLTSKFLSLIVREIEAESKNVPFSSDWEASSKNMYLHELSALFAEHFSLHIKNVFGQLNVSPGQVSVGLMSAPENCTFVDVPEANEFV